MTSAGVRYDSAPLLAIVAAHGLPNTVLSTVSGTNGAGLSQTLRTVDLLFLLEAANDARLIGLLEALANSPQTIFTDDQQGLIRSAARQHEQLQARLDELCAETVDHLEGAGLEVRVLKGAAHALLDYPDRKLRQYIDVDVLVRGRDLNRAAAVLLEVGHAKRGLPERVPGFEGRFGKGFSFVTLRGLGIDLHRTLAQPPYGVAVVEEDLFADPVDICVGGRNVQAMSAGARFMHACLHAGVGDYVPRLVPLRDVLQMASSPTLNVPAVLELTERWRARAVVQRSLREASERLPGTRWPVWANGLMAEPLSPWDKRAMTFALAHKPPGMELLPAMWIAVVGVSAKSRLLTAMLFPSKSYLSGRYQNRSHYWWSQASRSPWHSPDYSPRTVSEGVHKRPLP